MTPQDVLQADWQEVGHSPQPPVCTLWVRVPGVMVIILSIELTSKQVFRFSPPQAGKTYA